MPETMIKNRIEWKIGSENKLNDEQAGSRRGKGITDNIINIYNIAMNGLISGERAIAVFLDMKTAYDNILILKLIQKLLKMDI